MTMLTPWILRVGAQRAALGPRELLHLLQAPRRHAVPRAPLHCRTVVQWEGKVLPVVDLGALLEGVPPLAEPRFVAIVAYAHGVGPRGLGAVALDALPSKVELPQPTPCPLPEELHHWRPYVHACFEHQGPVPVLHGASLFRLR